MKLISISAGSFHCDGGALFGVIPKKLWNKVYPADVDNFTRLSLRCLLVDSGEKKILIETGLGNHYSEKHLQNNGVETGNHLEESLREKGYSPHEITDVLFTHLHWDHCTGAVKNQNGQLEVVFPNANFWCSKMQWDHSGISNAREKAAYHREVLDFLFESGRLNLVETEGKLFPHINVRFYNGHTPGQLIPFISFNDKTFVYMADLIPTAAHVPLLWIAAYDLFPVSTMEEKEKFLNEAVEKEYLLLFEHDFYTECATVSKNKKGFFAKEMFAPAEYFF